MEVVICYSGNYRPAIIHKVNCAYVNSTVDIVIPPTVEIRPCKFCQPGSELARAKTNYTPKTPAPKKDYSAAYYKKNKKKLNSKRRMQRAKDREFTMTFSKSPKQLEQEWKEKKACRPDHTKFFFSLDESEIEIAKGICSLCPVITECLEYSFRSHEVYGVWGGKDETERRRIRRSRARNS